MYLTNPSPYREFSFMRRNLHSAVSGTAAPWQWTAALALVFAFSIPAMAQNDVLNELYGSGVHAFNSGYYRQAYDDLTMAVRSGSQDPRVFYFRGLTYLQLGRPQEARADFRKGAALEMADNDRFYPVSKSLERIQGRARQQIESYRSSARLVAYQARERRHYERYKRIRKNEPNVLLTPDEATEMPAPAREPASKPAAEPAEEPAPDETEPEMPAEKPEADNPFAEEGDDKKPAEEMTEEKPEADDPFGEAGDKKEADEIPAEKEEGDDEQPAEEMKDEDDGEKPADDADKKPDEEKPEEGNAEKSADDGDKKPAAEEKPAEEKKPADDDPFGSK
jgi:tetratricopeptide (TPR) repeat protein